MWGLNAGDFLELTSVVAVLVLLEGLLSADNALVLAVMVRHLPKEQQKRALRYGVIGAFGFRLIAVLFASILLRYWVVKAAGGVYLLWIASSHLLFGDDDESERKGRFGSSFWGTVIGVELTDIIFSVDSILAAIASAEGLEDQLGAIVLFTVPAFGVVVDIKLLVIYIGGVLGIIAMRFIAGYFLILLDKFHGLAIGAYYLVGWIGLKLLGGGFYDALHPNPKYYIPPPHTWREQIPAWVNRLPLDMSDEVFWSGMGLLVMASLLYRPKQSPIEGSVVQNEPIPGLGPVPENDGVTDPAPDPDSDPSFQPTVIPTTTDPS